MTVSEEATLKEGGTSEMLLSNMTEEACMQFSKSLRSKDVTQTYSHSLAFSLHCTKLAFVSQREGYEDTWIGREVIKNDQITQHAL